MNTSPPPFPQRELLQSEMTQEEDCELTNFFGTYAMTMPPPQEDDDDDDIGEPDPFQVTNNMHM